jgi:Glycosyltransferase family 87
LIEAVAPGMPAVEAPFRSRLPRVAVALLAMEIALWLTLFLGAGLFRAGPNGKSMATDFAVFSGAAAALNAGQNPYNNRTLYQFERDLLQRQRLPVTSNVQNVRAGNPPLFYWALQPLARLPFQTAALLWILGMFACAAAGFAAALRFLGWERLWLPLAIFLLMPQVVLGACYGNVHAVVFAAVSAGLLIGARFPFWSGMVLGLAWLKPQLILPLVLLILMFHAARPARILGGFASATAAIAVLSLLATGSRMLWMWIEGLLSWSGSIGLEPNLASVVGLYAGWAPKGVSVVLGIGAFCVAVTLTLYARKSTTASRPLPLGAVGWLWAVWFLAAPFAHFPDEILLTLPVLALMGRDAVRLGQRGTTIVAYALFFSLALFPAGIGNVNLLSLVVVGVVWILWCGSERSDARREPAVASTAVWRPVLRGS